MKRFKIFFYNYLISARLPIAIWNDMKRTLGAKRLWRHGMETLMKDMRKDCTFDKCDYVVDDLAYSYNDGSERLNFEHMAGLFLNGHANSGIISQPIRQAAYLFHTIRELSDTEPNYQVLEIGRYRGGSTFLLAAALYGNGGDVISIDNRIVEKSTEMGQDYDEQLKFALTRYGLIHKVCLITSNSSTIRFDKKIKFDAVFIDGNHSFNAVVADINLALSGNPRDLFFDDTTDALTGGPSEVYHAIEILLSTGQWMVKKRVLRLIHLELKNQ